MKRQPGLTTLAREIRQVVAEWNHPGESQLSGLALWRPGQVIITSVIVVVNLVGVFAVLAVGLYVVPFPSVADVGHVRLVNAIAAAIYVAVAVPVGAFVGIRGLYALRQWLMEDRPATPREQLIVLRAPLRLFLVQVSLWLGAAAMFGVLDAHYYGQLGVSVLLTVAITGITTASCSYLLTERILRGSATRALAGHPPERLAVPGVATRALLAWALGTGLPVLGLVAIGVQKLIGQSHPTATDLAVAMVAIGGIGIAVGLLAVTLAARATADPVDSVRRALAKVQRGDFDVRVPVYDGTQIGQLQLGFNEMAAGLGERERIRQLFGTYVDPDVAEHLIREGTDAAGEEVDVTVMFIDVRDFTAFAEQRPAGEVVRAINELFERIVPIIYAHGGRVDKFVGDGLLAVFGAPRRLADHPDQALAAALETAAAVQQDRALKVGIGLNSGTVIAGNVGAADRLEFSVIGDAVNVASRVESATRQTGDTVLLTEHTRRLLCDSPVELVERPGIELKGKSEPVRLYAPVAVLPA